MLRTSFHALKSRKATTKVEIMYANMKLCFVLYFPWDCHIFELNSHTYPITNWWKHPPENAISDHYLCIILDSWFGHKTFCKAPLSLFLFMQNNNDQVLLTWSVFLSDYLYQWETFLYSNSAIISSIFILSKYNFTQLGFNQLVLDKWLLCMNFCKL